MKFWRNAAALLTVFHPKTTHTGSHSTPKDVKNDDRPGNVYENKGTSDTMSETISAICARLKRFLQKIGVSSSPNSSKVPRSSTLACPTARGHEPGGIERPVSESRQSQQDWRTILRDFVAATAPSDYRRTPPNRRYIGSGLYLPSVERRGLGEIVIAVDTSGTITSTRSPTAALSRWHAGRIRGGAFSKRSLPT
jgi:hypothetical protein